MQLGSLYAVLLSFIFYHVCPEGQRSADACRPTQCSLACRQEPSPKNGILRRVRPIFRPVTFLVSFGVVLVEFGVVLVAPRTGRCVKVAY